jgi:hypothetical protein
MNEEIVAQRSTKIALCEMSVGCYAMRTKKEFDEYRSATPTSI